MPDPFSRSALVRVLAGKGWPRMYIQRTADELQDHWNDLHAAALENGLDEAAAVADANTKLGSTEELVARLEAVNRNASFMARHPILCFALAPLLSTLLGFCGFAFIAWLVSGPTTWAAATNGGAQPDWDFWQSTLTWQHRVSAVLLPAMFCWLALRRLCGLKWATVACVIFSIQHGAQFARVAPTPAGPGGTFNFGYEFHSSFMALNHVGYALPLLVLCVTLYLSHKRSQLVLT